MRQLSITACRGSALARSGRTIPAPGRVRTQCCWITRCTAATEPDAAATTPAVPGDGGAASSEVVDAAKSEEYSVEMSQKMGANLTYRHELGIDYNYLLDDVIVGSCLQTPADVDKLAEEEGVTTVLCLQEDCDMEWFSIDVAAIRARCEERGDIRHVRFPIRDFDPFDLRRRLPKAVARVASVHDPKQGKIYIHCTAGMGRAPGVALAYVNWMRGLQLEPAWQALRAVRVCSPRLESIRAATADLLLGFETTPVTISFRRRGTAQLVQVAGLDVGWHSKVDLAPHPETRVLQVQRDLLPGRYPFKFVVDEHWTYSIDYPTYKDNDNINNFLEVIPKLADMQQAMQQQRLLDPAGQLLAEEQEALHALLCPWCTHD